MFIILYLFLITKMSSISFVDLIFCFVLFNSSGNEFYSCTNICIPKVIDWCNFLLYQVVLSFSCLIILFFVLSPSRVYFKNMLSWTFKRKNFILCKVKLFCITVLFSPNVCSTEGCVLLCEFLQSDNNGSSSNGRTTNSWLNVIKLNIK